MEANPTCRYRIIYDKEGQLCNRFWSYLSFVYWAIENNTKVYVLFWDPQIKYFHNLCHNQYIRFPLRNWLWNLKVHTTYPFRNLILRVFNSRRFAIFVTSQRGKKMGFVKGWGASNPVYCRTILDHHPHIRKMARILFKPNNAICHEVDTFFHSSLSNNIVIGIHIRRGDYKNWCNGKYYYSDEVYANLMRHLQKLFRTDVKFFCATNEKIPPSTITDEFPTIFIQNATAAHDLYALSLCDYIIGPPSTFSQWASYYGQVPLYLIERPEYMPSKKDFSSIYSLDHFINGYVLNIDG